MTNFQIKTAISANICRPTLRGVGSRHPSNSWFPLWMLNRYFNFTWDNTPDFLFYGDINRKAIVSSSPNAIRIFLTGENIKANWDETDYALTHERVYNKRHWRAPLWRQFYDPGNTVLNRDFKEVKTRVSLFCNFIYSNERAKERIQFFKLLNKYKHIDSGGKVLNNIGGRIDNKLEMVSKSKFTIAFENESHPGYATEKIIEPLIQGSIPIYWGDTTIAQDFNPDCFINVHNYDSFEDVIKEVIKIDTDENLWEKYIEAPIFKNNILPQELTNESYINFFNTIFKNKKSYVSCRSKKRQLQKYLWKLKFIKIKEIIFSIFYRIKTHLLFLLKSLINK